MQNADDAGATRFAIMLDLRQHPLVGLRFPNLDRVQGDAMILFDDAGFQPKDWKSLINIHQSEKKKSPFTTGWMRSITSRIHIWMIA